MKRFQNKRASGYAPSRQNHTRSQKYKQIKHTCQDKNMHTDQTHSLSITHRHAHTQTCTQWSQCWLLPVGLWSLNCLSDSSLSKFTMRDPALCLPKLLQLKHTHTCAHKKRNTRTHIDGQKTTWTCNTHTQTLRWKHFKSLHLSFLVEVLGK